MFFSSSRDSYWYPPICATNCVSIFFGCRKSRYLFFSGSTIAIASVPYFLRYDFFFLFPPTAANDLSDSTVWYHDILTSVILYAGHVDANIFSVWWPQELDGFRICVISGPESRPIFSCFSRSQSADLEDIILRCYQDHFTLWKPVVHHAASTGSISSYGMPSTTSGVFNNVVGGAIRGSKRFEV